MRSIAPRSDTARVFLSPLTASPLAILCVLLATCCLITNLADAQVLHLPLDSEGGDVALDQSGQGRDGMLRNGAAFENTSGDGSPGSVRLDGANDFIELPPIDVRGNGLTLAAWFNADRFPGSSRDPRIISKASGTGADEHVFMISTIKTGSTTKLRGRVRVAGSTRTIVATSGNLAIETWYHAALTYDGSVVRLYLDGVSVGAKSHSGAVDTDPALPVTIGGQPQGAGDRYFAGLIDDVFIFDRALSAGEIASLFNSPPNLSPTALPDTFQTTEGVTLDVLAANGVLTNDVDPELSPLQAILVSGVAQGALTLEPDGGFQYSPTPNFVGSDSFVYHAFDGTSASNPVSVTLTVAPAVNLPPIALDDSLDAAADEPTVFSIALTLLSNDSDANGDTLSLSSFAQPVEGTLALQSETLVYTPPAGFQGTDTFTYLATDGTLESNPATVTITVAVPPLNELPTAIPDSLRVVPTISATLSISQQILSNDVDPEGAPLAITSFTQPVSGTLTQQGDSFTYTPAPGFLGTDTFDYVINDGIQDSAPATVSLLVNHAPRFVSGSPGFLKQVLDNSMPATHAIATADFDADGDLDVVATAYDADTIRWYEQTPSGAFLPHLVVDDLTQAYPVHTEDLDQDGDIDILAAGYKAGIVAWYENDGLGNFQERVIQSDAVGPHSVVTADLDDDNDIDLLTTEQLSGKVVWHENLGDETFVPHLIDDTAIGAKRAEFTDLDGDGDLDVVGAHNIADEIAWYENNSLTFTKFVIDDTADGAYYVFPADVDQDGDVDLLAASQRDDDIWLYRNDGNQSFTRSDAATNVDGARTVVASDFNRDGFPDALSASPDDNTISWHENDGTGAFVERIVDDAALGAYSVEATDVNGDGQRELITASRDSAEIAIYSVNQFHAASLAEASLTIDSNHLQINDPDDGPANLIYELTSPPSFGTLLASGVALSAGAQFTQEAVNSGLLTYTPNSGGASDEFSFAATDIAGGIPPLVGSLRLSSATADVLVRLPFDENAGSLAADSSENGNDATLRSGATFDSDTPDSSASSVRFDGSNDWVDLGALDASGAELTLAAWFKADSFPGSSRDPRIISKATGTSANAHYFMLSTVAAGNDTRLRARLRVDDNITTLIATSGDLSPNTWYHAAMTYNGNTVRLYLDGNEVGSTSLTGAIDAATSVPIAVGAQPPGAGNRFFDGRIDDVVIALRGLSLPEIQALASATPPIDTQPPTAPTGVMAAARSATQVVVSWSPSTDNVGVFGYQVIRGTIMIAQTGATTLFIDSTVQGGTSYSYEIRALDAAGNLSATSSPPAVVTRRIPDTDPPTPPAGVMATALSSSTIEVAWISSNDNVAVAGYRLTRNDGFVTILGPSLAYLDSGLDPETTYAYTVEAFDAAQNYSAPSSPPAAATTEATPPDTTPPSIPAEVTATALSTSEIELSWVASADDAGVALYEIYRNTLFLGSTQLTVFSDVGLAPATSNSYELRAIDTSGNSSPLSAPVLGTTLSVPPTITGALATYDFADTTNLVAIDGSGNGNDGTLESGASGSALGNGSVRFNGTSSVVTLGGLDVPQGAPGLTLMAWMNADDFGTRDGRIISKSTGTPASAHYWMLSTVRSDNVMRLRFRLKTSDGTTTTLIASSGNLQPNQWYHTAATYDGATMRLYLDGVEVGSMAKAGPIAVDRTVPVGIGANPLGGRHFDGHLDEVQIYERGLDPAEIQLARSLTADLFDASTSGPARSSVFVPSSLDGSAQPSYVILPTGYDASGSAVPLLVSLHTWSSNYEQRYLALEEQADQRGWIYLFPNFRGRNDRPEACGSDLAQQDILDAVNWAKQTYNVDPSRVYLTGVSGGGHMTLLMAGRYPDEWAACSAWVGISDLVEWYAVQEQGGYGEMMRQVCGGAPGTSPAVDLEYQNRSPLTFLAGAAGIPVDIAAGLQDGHTGSVPIRQSLTAFNVLAATLNQPTITEAEILELSQPGSLSNPQPSDLVQDPTYGRDIFLRRFAGDSRVTIFEGGHEGIAEAACAWLSGFSQ